MDFNEQSDVPAPHRDARASLSKPAFWSDREWGKGKKISKGPKCPRMCGRSETSPDLDPKKEEGGKKDSTTPDDDDDEAPPYLCSGLGPAAGERGFERKPWETEGVPSLNPCSPALVSTLRCTPRHPPGARGRRGETSGERKWDVWRGRNYA